MRKVVWCHAPDRRDVGAVLGVVDVAPAGQLIALLPVLAAALAVALAGYRAVATRRPADTPGCEDDVDRTEHVHDPIGVVLEPAGMEQEAGFRLPPQLRGLADGPLGDAGHLGRA